VYRGTLGELAVRSRDDANMSRGELVLVVGGAPDESDAAAESRAAMRTLELLLQELPVSQAARLAAQLTGRSRKELYEHALSLAPGTSDGDE
jgi:16S rRNA (cytidine1402-2'-O)-methyltransferase